MNFYSVIFTTAVYFTINITLEQMELLDRMLFHSLEQAVIRKNNARDETASEIIKKNQTVVNAHVISLRAIFSGNRISIS